MKKELLIYLAVLLLSALFMHPDLLLDPVARFKTMIGRANYYHPFLFALGIYLLIGAIRLLVKWIRRFIKR